MRKSKPVWDLRHCMAFSMTLPLHFSSLTSNKQTCLLESIQCFNFMACNFNIFTFDWKTIHSLMAPYTKSLNIGKCNLFITSECTANISIRVHSNYEIFQSKMAWNVLSKALDNKILVQKDWTKILFIKDKFKWKYV